MNKQDYSETSVNLIAAVRTHDGEAWHRLNEIYSPLVYEWARRSGLGDWDSRDIVQEVFRRVATHLARFRKEQPGDTFRGWLWTITRNEIRGWHRKQAKLQGTALGGSAAQAMMSEVPEWVEASDSDASLDEAGESGLVQRATRAIRDDFAEHTWQAFWRATVHGQSSGEIATDLGMTPVAVRQAKFRVLARLREYLG